MPRTIRDMANEYAQITGEQVFLGIENPGKFSPRKYLFSDATIIGHEKAREHMMTHLEDARANFN